MKRLYEILFFAIVLLAVSAAAPAQTLTVTLKDASFSCELTGNVTVNTMLGGIAATCTDTSATISQKLAGGTTTPPPSNPPPSSSPPSNPPPTGSGATGVLAATGKTIALSEDRVGLGTVCVPDCNDPEIIIYDWLGGTQDNYVPGCIGTTRFGYNDMQACRGSASFRPGTVYAQRLLTGTDSIPPYLQFITNGVGDMNGNYDVGISPTPGDTQPASSLCHGATSRGQKNIYTTFADKPNSYSCPLQRGSLYYANMKATSARAEGCGTSIFCTMRVIAW